MSSVRRQRQAKEDFQKENLPHTRRQLYFDVIKQRWRLLLGLGLLLLLGALPILLCFFFSTMNASAIASDYQGVTDEAKLAEGASLIRQSRNEYNLFLLPGFLFLALFLGPVFRVAKELCFGKGIYVWDDFKLGVKQNTPSFLLLLGWNWLLLYLTLMVYHSDLGNAFVSSLPLGLYFVMAVPLSFVTFSLLSTYKNGFFGTVKVSFYFYFKAFFPLLLPTLAFFAPLLSLLIPNYLISYGILALLVVTYYPLVILWYYFLMASYFDEGINKENYPEQYRQGLY